LPIALPASNLEAMTHAPADPMMALQQALAGRYVLQGELGRGGMGIVYLAYEEVLDRPVALKLLPPAAVDSAWRDRFLKEAQAAAGLSHPNIVPIHVVDRVGEFVFFTMAYVDGETLAQRVERAGPMPAGDVLRVLRDVALAAAYAHGRGVLHRDLKPDNIILERDSGRALVLDFGIAQVAAERGSDPAQYIEGSIPFVSPERVLGRPEDGRSDIYSLGATAYFAATGRPPFDHAAVDQILRQHVERPAPPLAVVGQDGDTTLARVVQRCLAKDPATRFPTADELAAALEQAPELRGDTPVALRAFVGRSLRVARSTAALSVIGVAAATILLGALANGDVLWAVGAAAAIALALAAPVLAVLPTVRRVLKAGHTPEDMVAALGQELERAAEELVFEQGRDAPHRGRRLRRVAYGGLSLAGLAAIWIATVPIGTDPAFWVVFGGTATALAAGAAGLVRARRRRHTLAGKLWLSFWNSPLGAWTARLAGLGVRAAERRAAFKRVPRVVRLMDSEIERIDDWIQNTDAFEREQQRDVTLRLKGNRAALKALRARLATTDPHGPGPASLTSDIAAARAVCDMVDLLLAANVEVEHLLDANLEVEDACPPRTRDA
jgi:predicted Ser/Thr protein kinase